MSYPQQPHPEQPPADGWTSPPRKRINPWLIVLAGAGILLLISVVGSIVIDLSGNSPDKQKPAAMGAPVKVGDFEVTVTKMDCSHSSVGLGALGKKAQGRFCVIDVTVANTSAAPHTFFSGDQKAYAGDVKFDPDDAAEGYANGDDLGAAEINPGNKVSGPLVFDVPKDKTLTELWLHDGSLGGDGVPVALVEK